MIDLADWKVTRKQKKLIKQVLNSGRLTYGDKTRELEQRFAEIHGAKYALFTSSGTAALKIALHAFKDKYKWKDGDEILVPSVTFVATVNSVVMNNLKPVLVDVDPNTANIDPALIEKAITKKTQAIMPVHLLGQQANMAVIKAIAEKHKLKIIEDSCETMFVNDLEGDVACFSSYVAHLLVTGVGGFILTNDEKMATVMRSMMFHGRDESYLNIDDRPDDVSKRFFFPRFGYSDRMTELEAALGLSDLDSWPEMIQKRQDNARYVYDRISQVMAHAWMKEDPNTRRWAPVANTDFHAFMFLPLYAPRRDELIAHLEQSGVRTRTMMPLISQPIMKKYVSRRKFPEAEWIGKNGLLLGCHQYLKRKDLDYMVECIKEFYA